MQWFRQYHDTPYNWKIQRLSDRQYRIWHICLCLASANEERRGVVPVDAPERIASILDCEVSEVVAALDVMQSPRALLFVRLDDGALVPKDWQGRQYVAKSDDAAPRMKASRARKKEAKKEQSTELQTTEAVTSPLRNRQPDTNVSGSTLRDRYREMYQQNSNKTAAIGEVFQAALGREPNYSRLGRMLKRAGSGSKMIDAIMDASRQSITDDPHDYLEKILGRVRKSSDPDGFVY